MSRHAKNCTASAFFTYHEKKKLKHGTQKERLGKDSLNTFDSCRLCLKPLLLPTSCQEGHLFCKECIYASLLTQKQEINRQMKKYKAQQEQLIAEQRLKKAAELELQLEAFDKVEYGILPTEHLIFTSKGNEAQQPQNVPSTPTKKENETSNPQLLEGSHLPFVMDRTFQQSSDKKAHYDAINKLKMKLDAQVAPSKKLTSFWVPSLTPEAPAALIPKPNKSCLCPEGRHPVSRKKLISVQFQTVAGVDRKDPNKVQNMRFECPVCSKTLNNTIRAVLLKSCGHVFCAYCFENFVMDSKTTTSGKDGSQKRKRETLEEGEKTNEKRGNCIVCSVACSEKDSIQLQSGGTGYSAHGVALEASTFSPSAWV